MKISIPNPCHENWSEMLPAEKGRFCAVCQKCVTDFTKLSDKEILKTLQKPNQCGRFSRKQLEEINRKLKEENKVRFPRFLRYSTLMIGLGLGGTLVAQEKDKTEIVESKNNNSSQLKSDSNRVITGNVNDDFGFPLYDVKIIFPNNQVVFTDESGNFKIELINFSEDTFKIAIYDLYNEKHIKKIDISKSNYIELVCNSGIALTGEVDFIGRKRTFTGKILHTISWPFRQIGKLF